MKQLFLSLVYFVCVVWLVGGCFAPIIARDSSTDISATVGAIAPTPLPIDTTHFNLFGYTSPHALVAIQNPGLHYEVFASSEGYFIFKYLSLTSFREDICLVAEDTNNRATSPLCIPPPTGKENRQIGPVLLPPSTSLSSGNAYIGDTVTLTGQTLPNVDVKLSLFTDELKQKKLSLIPVSYAYTLPQFSLKSNDKGEYSLTLPTASSQFLRMFTRALYEGNSTPKSHTLILDIFPLWMIVFKFFSTYLSLLKDHLVELIILFQLYFLLIYFLKHHFKPHTISVHRKQWLALRQTNLLILPHDIMRTSSHQLSVRSVALVKRETSLLRKFERVNTYI